MSARRGSTAPIRLAIVSTHPIQYNAPAFRELAARAELNVKVFYEWEGPGKSIDHEFGRAIEWDVPLLDAYPYEFVPNVSSDPGTHHFRGIDNPSLVDRIRKWNPNVLLVYGWPFLSHLQVLRAFHGRIPVMFRGDSTLLDERPGFRTGARRVWLRWVYRQVDVALYAGERNKDYFKAHGLRSTRLRWAPHAVDNERFAADDGARNTEARAWRRSLDIEDEDVVFLFSGKLSPRKDPKILLSAFMGMHEFSSGIGAHLIFVGEGSLGASLREAAGERPNVHFLGFQNQAIMPVVYRLADVTVLPSRSGETWGLSINESLACGRPVIVSDRVGCAVDLVRRESTGLVFEHGSVTSLRGVMICLLNDAGARTRMAREGVRIIRDWSVPVYAESVAAVVTEMAQLHV